MTLEQVLWLVYGVGSIALLIPIARWSVKHIIAGDPIEPMDLALAALLALCAAPMWPLLIPGWWVYRVLTLDANERKETHR